MNTFTCFYCGCSFSVKRKFQKFCSKKCANSHQAEERNKAENTKAKTCDTCGKLKAGGFFSLIDKYNYSGPRKDTCKMCSKVKSNEERKARIYDRDIVGYLISQAKQRAKAKGLDFNIERSDIVVPEKCPVLGVNLAMGYKEMKGNVKNFRFRYSPSIDRIDSTKGYIKGNVVVISTRANMIKSDATIEELRSLLEYYEGMAITR